MPSLLLLGPQRPAPNLGPALRSLAIDGPFTVVTAGWQEREGEIDELRQHLGSDVVDLRLYHRAEDVFRRDPPFALAYRDRQTRLRELQRLYRIRLGHALAAVRELMATDGDAVALARARAGALAAVRTLDRQQLREVRRVHAAFEARWRPAGRDAVAEHRAEVAALVRRSAALLIAGGHVAILLNRLRLFALDEAARERPVVAWSAGVMAVAEAVVLFHDRTPQGSVDPEVLEHGLGLVHGVVPLPHAGRRLATDDRLRVRLFASRFAPARCLTFDQGSLLHLDADGGAWRRAERLRLLGKDGSISEFAPPCPAA